MATFPPQQFPGAAPLPGQPMGVPQAFPPQGLPMPQDLNAMQAQQMPQGYVDPSMPAAPVPLQPALPATQVIGHGAAAAQGFPTQGFPAPAMPAPLPSSAPLPAPVAHAPAPTTPNEEEGGGQKLQGTAREVQKQIKDGHFDAHLDQITDGRKMVQDAVAERKAVLSGGVVAAPSNAGVQVAPVAPATSDVQVLVSVPLSKLQAVLAVL